MDVQPTELVTVTRKDYVPVGRGQGTRCVDDRGGLREEDKNDLGPQMPGGSEHLMDLMQLAVLQDGEQLEDAVLFEMTDAVYASDAAQEFELKPGVHIDDEHGHIVEAVAIESRVEGCGYDGVRAKVLQEMGVSVAYDKGTRIAEARRRGWNIQVLTGAHAGSHEGEPKATAAVNRIKGTTLDTNRLLQPGRLPSFGHDIWVVESLLPEMVKQLRDKGYGASANRLEKFGMQWSEEMFVRTLMNLGQSGKTIEAE